MAPLSSCPEAPARAPARVGMLHAPFTSAELPDVIGGTSAGAINGAFIASRPQTVRTARELAAIWRGLRRGQIFPLNFLLGLLGFVGARDHLVPGSSLRKLVRRARSRSASRGMPIQLHVVAVDVLTGEELLLSTGPALDAVMASAAIRRSCRLSSGRVASSWTAARPTTRRSRMRCGAGRPRDLRAAHGARVRPRAPAGKRARDGAARVEPADP